ncbi:holo-ACP synthase [Clostridium tetanomorphum]|uniref:citrate lyase holo-[acyl-carrier protein] synthase n=1 Tax=Clostridium tetanomorphum TaxID=1553 RepID=A0A923EA83_CLOTT|nr:citrate lyase holo-[acyl-carrier protein] synthase [Clostridium tetanomorphum]KAJ52273.1 citX protein [Clostridium tetanomorphum DSM 665]MBC2397576.1 citrate lyase holo-[acyl-carrier protein] synthase [Clostridium tetanomorphum]MBP1863722.1 holo-ACP synthase [Clostridium tetanomorphum]NRS86298.1 holo-ACP synthase [Clostridium tetanomorphum]NRZ95672.1 holo-ACP synthase [Clostridium tetanomorphum]
MNRYTIEDLLLAKEERVNYQQEIVNKYKLPLISMRVNYPGINKDNDLTRKVAEVIKNELKNKFKEYIVYENYKYTAEGPVFTLVIKNIAEEIKRKTVDVEENHMLGRCVDIDVYDELGNGISRTSLGLSSRKCFLCEDKAQNCVRAKKHHIEDVVKFVENKYNEYIIKNNI